MNTVILSFGFSPYHQPTKEHFNKNGNNVSIFYISMFDFKFYLGDSYKIKQAVFNADKIVLDTHGSSSSSTTFFHDEPSRIFGRELEYIKMAEFINSLYFGMSSKKDVVFSLMSCFAALPRDLKEKSLTKSDFFKKSGKLDNLDYTNSLAYNFYTELLRQPNLKNFNIKLVAKLTISRIGDADLIANMLSKIDINKNSSYISTLYSINKNIEKDLRPLNERFYKDYRLLVFNYYANNSYSKFEHIEYKIRRNLASLKKSQIETLKTRNGFKIKEKLSTEKILLIFINKLFKDIGIVLMNKIHKLILNGVIKKKLPCILKEYISEERKYNPLFLNLGLVSLSKKEINKLEKCLDKSKEYMHFEKTYFSLYRSAIIKELKKNNFNKPQSLSDIEKINRSEINNTYGQPYVFLKKHGKLEYSFDKIKKEIIVKDKYGDLIPYMNYGYYKTVYNNNKSRNEYILKKYPFNHKTQPIQDSSWDSWVSRKFCTRRYNPNN